MKAIQENGLVFNSKYCDIHYPQISFYGCMLTADGTELDLAKVQGTVAIPIPKDV